MSEGNGHGRNGEAPFGPHGEDCDCDVPEEESPSDEATEVNEDPPQVQLEYDYENRHEIAWAAAAQALAEQFLNSNLAMVNEGIPFSRRQAVHVVTMLLRGYSLAKESAYMIEQHYADAMVQLKAAEETEKASDDPLHDLKETFSRGPQS